MKSLRKERKYVTHSQDWELSRPLLQATVVFGVTFLFCVLAALVSPGKIEERRKSEEKSAEYIQEAVESNLLSIAPGGTGGGPGVYVLTCLDFLSLFGPSVPQYQLSFTEFPALNRVLDPRTVWYADVDPPFSSILL